MQSSALHARFGTEAEFSEGNNVIPANIICVVKDATTGAVSSIRIGDGVTEFEQLPSFEPFTDAVPVG